jgi:capsular exopolysaccharide synthesis family protein
VLHEAQVESGLKSVIITSALPGEGKTLTAANLALTLTESYERRVLLVDADLRAPSLHHALDLPNERGLGEALRDSQEPQFVEAATGMSLLAAGRPGTTPLAGLTSRRMGENHEYCHARFDWVLIDTPPVGVLPDAQVLTRLVGAVLFVVGAGSTPAVTVERAIAELGGPDAIFGIGLNRVEERRIPDANYYGRYLAK